MLKTLLVLKKTLCKLIRGDASSINKYDNLLRLDNNEHLLARITINENLK